MTKRPRLATNVTFANGVAALALFAVMAYVFMTASFPKPDGFPAGSITASIGYAMFGMLDQAAIPAESFLVVFIVIAVVLDAALDASLLLARREEDGSVVTALTDGGRRLRGGVSGTESGAADADSEATDADPEATDADPEAADADGTASDAATEGGEA
ncbi:hypothetical protein [uncultured Halovibrio sp.]|uniref:hypothetical protein n=1 Tax=uncultured Halovibrio sp. TaxID=985049 RepID=UPI0025F5A196|nr:hypothetical protein [uncultured Halovibrio sp.]